MYWEDEGYIVGKKKFRAEVVSIIPWFDIGLLKSGVIKSIPPS